MSDPLKTKMPFGGREHWAYMLAVDRRRKRRSVNIASGAYDDLHLAPASVILLENSASTLLSEAGDRLLLE